MADPNRMTVAIEPCSCGSIRASFARHADFPETHGEGPTAKAAGSRLAGHLTVSLDHAPTDWQRGQIRNAIDDINAFAAQSTECAGPAPCRGPAHERDGLRNMLVRLDDSPHRGQRDETR